MRTPAKKKSPRVEQYRDIVMMYGVKLEQCVVLAYGFPQTNGPIQFHWRLLMADPCPKYYLFDSFDNVAQIVIPKDKAIADAINEIATSCGGIKRAPAL